MSMHGLLRKCQEDRDIVFIFLNPGHVKDFMLCVDDTSFSG